MQLKSHRLCFTASFLLWFKFNEMLPSGGHRRKHTTQHRYTAAVRDVLMTNVCMLQPELLTELSVKGPHPPDPLCSRESLQVRFRLYHRILRKLIDVALIIQ